MRKEIKLAARRALWVVVMLLLSTTSSLAQSSASASATVTIVSPATLSSNQSNEFAKVESPSVFDLLFRGGNVYQPKAFVKIPSYNSRITAADLMINGNGADVYALTIPQKIFLINVSGTERMIANVLPVGASQDEALRNGSRHLILNAGLQINTGQATGRYASQAFDVTVNFN